MRSMCWGTSPLGVQFGGDTEGVVEGVARGRGFKGVWLPGSPLEYRHSSGVHPMLPPPPGMAVALLLLVKGGGGRGLRGAAPPPPHLPARAVLCMCLGGAVSLGGTPKLTPPT